jgi:hypothetical protein
MITESAIQLAESSVTTPIEYKPPKRAVQFDAVRNRVFRPSPTRWPHTFRQRMTKYTHGEPISRYTARKASVMSAPSV